MQIVELVDSLFAASAVHPLLFLQLTDPTMAAKSCSVRDADDVALRPPLQASTTAAFEAGHSLQIQTFDVQSTKAICYLLFKETVPGFPA